MSIRQASLCGGIRRVGLDSPSTPGPRPGGVGGEARGVKMAMGTYPMGTDHPCPHPPGQNLFHWVTR
jgi:hypothetical protein